MKRLTERDEYGNADIIGVDCVLLQGDLAFEETNLVTEALNRLAEYEDIGLTAKELTAELAEKDKRIAELEHEVDIWVPKRYRKTKTGGDAK